MKWNDDVPGCEYRIADYEARGDRIQRAAMGDDMGSDAFWERLRAMSRAERWRLSNLMTQMFFDEVRAEIEAEHPQASEQDRKVEFVARMYGPSLAGHYRRHLEKRESNVNSD
jgi:hypothetical protein